MNRKKVTRALKFCIIGLIVVTIVLFALGTHTLIVGLMSAISSEGGTGLKLINNDPSGDWLFILDSKPVNKAFLGEKLFMSIGVLDRDGKYLAVNSTSVPIAPGEQKPFQLTLTIPAQTVIQYNLNTTQIDDVRLELLFGISTLGDLLSFRQTMRISGGNATVEG